MMDVASHLVIAPILIPLVMGALLLLFDERERRLKDTLTLLSCLAMFGSAILLLISSNEGGTGDDAGIIVYLLGNWPSPIAINLVLDRLSAIMLTLAGALAIPAFLFATARWEKAGTHFHSLFLFLIMGLNGAFLTGDLFNLFVFFEVLLAASYGLMLHGSGPARVKWGMHYIVINLATSLLFLIGVAMIYSETGTLNMALLSEILRDLDADSRPIAEAGAAVLSIAFLVKAGIWPLNFWLPNAYASAAAPVAAIFAVMTKVGLYIVLRLSLLLFGADAGASSDFGNEVLFFAGLTTILFGTVGVLASQALGRLAGYSVLISSGTLLAAVGFSHSHVTAGALFYLVISTLAVSALFMLIELIERGQDPVANILAVTLEAYGEGDEDPFEQDDEVGVVIPQTIAVLGICFGLCALLLAGLPPLSGFLAKFSMLTSMFNPLGLGEGVIRNSAWWFASFLILSGFASLIAMSRAGIRSFWAPLEAVVPRVLVIEIVPVIFLLGLTVALTVAAGPAMQFFDAAAAEIHTPNAYVKAVMEALQVAPKSAGGVN